MAKSTVNIAGKQVTPGWAYFLAGALLYLGAGTRFGVLMAGFGGVAIIAEASATLGTKASNAKGQNG